MPADARERLRRAAGWLLAFLVAVSYSWVTPGPVLAEGGGAVPAEALKDQGVNESEEWSLARSLSFLLSSRDEDRVRLEDGSTLPTRDVVDMVISYRDGYYYVWSRRGSIRFQRFRRGEGYSYKVEVLDPNPYGAVGNPLENQDPTALATLSQELDASYSFVQEEQALPEGGTGTVRRNLVEPSKVSYPYAYERISQLFDDPKAGDVVVVPRNDGPDTPAGGHGHLGVVQSRTTLLISGRGARRTPLSPEEERALEAKAVDVAPTVAAAIGVRPFWVDTGELGRTLNGSPSKVALLRRQDGRVLRGLLEPVLNTFVVVIDGLAPQYITPELTPRICALARCPGSTPEPGSHATVYRAARAVMVTETNANHAAMMTGAYPDFSGMVANLFFDRRKSSVTSLDRPELVLAPTLFDTIEVNKPWIRTAAIMGKSKLRRLFDCTRPFPGAPCGPSRVNPEGIEVNHLRPDYLGGAVEPGTSPSGPLDLPAEPISGSGYTLDNLVMDLVIKLSKEEDPDFTFVNLAFVDGAQHLTTPGSPAALAAIRNADAQVGRLVDYLKASGKWGHSVLVVTADHSFASPAAATGTIDLSSLVAGAGPVPLAVVSHGGSASVYVNREGFNPAGPLTPAERDTLREVRRRALATRGVREALYRLPVEGEEGLLSRVHPDWHLTHPRVGELLLTADEGHRFVTSPGSPDTAIPGAHGHPFARQVPFVVASGGPFVVDRVVEPARVDSVNFDDTRFNPLQAEAVDVAATAAWLYGVPPPAYSAGRPLFEAFAGAADVDGDGVPDTATPPQALQSPEPLARRALVVIFDANNSVDLHELLSRRRSDGTPFRPCQDPPDPEDPVPNLRCLASRGTLTRYGDIVGFPSVTFPNHNVVGTGAYNGHHGLVNNRFYERETRTVQAPIDPTDPRNPIYFGTSRFLRPDVETLHEAVHRSFGDWSPANPSGAFTAAVDEPSYRGADYASLEVWSSKSIPPLADLANLAEFREDTTMACAEADPEGYGLESVLSHLAQSEVRGLLRDPSHPPPTYLIVNFPLTDGAGHSFGPHSPCTLAAYRDTDRRLGRVIKAMKEAGIFGETLIVVTGDHGMENQRKGGFSGGLLSSALRQAGVPHVETDNFFYFLTLRVLPEPRELLAGKRETLRIRVLDDDTGEPIQGARVTVVGAEGEPQGITDAGGEVSLEVKPVCSDAMVRAEKDGYARSYARLSVRGARPCGLGAAEGVEGPFVLSARTVGASRTSVLPATGVGSVLSLGLLLLGLSLGGRRRSP